MTDDAARVCGALLRVRTQRTGEVEFRCDKPQHHDRDHYCDLDHCRIGFGGVAWPPVDLSTSVEGAA